MRIEMRARRRFFPWEEKWKVDVRRSERSGKMRKRNMFMRARRESRYPAWRRDHEKRSEM